MSEDRRYITQTVTGTQYYYQQPRATYQVEFVKPELDLDYVKTLSGMLKCICIALDFVCFICLLAGGPAYYSGAGWATFVCIFGMLVSLTLLVLYLFRIVDMLQQIPWIVGEMTFCFAWAVFFFICGCVLAIAAARFHGITGYGAAAFFAFGAMCAYGFDSYLKFLAWRHNEIATGGAGAGPEPLSYGYRAPSDGGNQQRKVIINEPMHL